MILHDPETRSEWLVFRQDGIGGSDAACVVGKNKYRSNVDLWMEKTGQMNSEDISDNPAVVFGVNAEPLLRRLFSLNYPQYRTEYHPYRMYSNDENPFIYATLDGELHDCFSGEDGVLEIKTCTIQNAVQWDEWENRIPDAYYIQVLHQLAATGRSFVILCACLRYYPKSDTELRMQIRHYRIDRNDVQDDIDQLVKQEKAFWEMVKANQKPALILPEI